MLALVLPLLLSPLAQAGRPGPWSSWSPEALARAQRDDRPLLVLLGDSLCAPCRRAEAELTADGEALSFLAENLVGVRVDRFERPDVDDFLLTATAVLGGSRVYPLVVLLTPDGRPFAVLGDPGSEDRADAAGLKAFSSRGALEYRKDRPRVESLARQTLESLRRAQRSETPSRPLDAATLKRARTGTMENFGTAVTAACDGTYPHASLRLLLEEHERTGEAGLLRMAELALDFFAKSSEPRNLRDTALLLRAYLAAHAVSGKALYREKAAGLARSAGEMADPAGGFRAARGTLPSEADERVFAGWNGLMIGALAAAGRELELKEDTDAAREAAGRVLARVGPLEQLKRSARGPDTGGPAFLEDYAFLADGFLELHEADPAEARWLKEAVKAVEVAIARFWDPAQGGFFDTDAAHEPLPLRIRSGYDDGRLSGNGVMASVLVHLARATGETRYRDLGRQVVEAFLGDLERTPRGMESLACAAGELLGPVEAAEPGRLAGRAREVRAGVTLEASASPLRGGPEGGFEVTLGIVVAPGWQVVAHEAQAKDLVGLSVSVPRRDMTVSKRRYPPATGTRDPRGVAPFAVLEGRASVALTVRSPAGAPAGQARLPLRVVYQACDAAGCRPPESALLDVALPRP